MFDLNNPNAINNIEASAELRLAEALKRKNSGKWAQTAAKPVSPDALRNRGDRILESVSNAYHRLQNRLGMGTPATANVFTQEAADTWREANAGRNRNDRY